MNTSYRNSQNFRLLKIPFQQTKSWVQITKKSLIALLISINTVSLAQQQISTLYNVKQNTKINDFPDKATQSYKEFISKQKSWDELKLLVANDLMTVEELGIIACSEFKRPPVEVELKQPFKAWRLKQQNESWILNTFYKWNTYELNGKDLCIEMIEPHQQYLNEDDSRILLSASKNYHFIKLNLAPAINRRQTIYYDLANGNCTQVKSSFDKEKSIVRNNCREDITYYTTINIPKKEAIKYSGIEPLPNEFENFVSSLGAIMCSTRSTYSWSLYEPSSNESPYICVKTKNYFSQNYNKNIEIHFITDIQKDRYKEYIAYFRKLPEEQKRKLINKDIKQLVVHLGLKLEENDTYNLGYIDESIKIFNQSKHFRHFGVNRSEPLEILQNTKEKIIIYVKFLYGKDINYHAKYDLDRKIAIVKLNQTH